MKRDFIKEVLANGEKMLGHPISILSIGTYGRFKDKPIRITLEKGKLVTRIEKHSGKSV